MSLERIADLEEVTFTLQRQVSDILLWLKELDTNVNALNQITTDMYVKKVGIPDTLGGSDGGS